MRKQFQEILQQPLTITQHRATLLVNPNSIQQVFYQTIGNLHILRQKEPVNELKGLMEYYRGPYSTKVLKYKFMGHCMENKIAGLYYLFNVLSLLSNWIEFLDDYKKAPVVNFRSMIQLNVKYRGLDSFEDCIVYLHYIGLDLIGLLKREKKEKKADPKNQESMSQLESDRESSKEKLSGHLNADDLLWFVNIVLPKVLFNVIIPLEFFPENFLPFSGQNVDLLYRNENVEMMARSKPHYQNFLRTVLRMLCEVPLEQSQTKELMLQAFKYYYLFHHDKNLGASQIVINSFKKISAAVRFALNDEILLYFTILKKIGKSLFLDYLKDKFDWAEGLMERLNDQSMIGNPKEGLKPSPTTGLPLIYCAEVARGKRMYRYLQVYHKYSLLFFKMKSCKDDITFRLYYLGNFNSPKERRELLMTRQKQAFEYQGSVEIVEPGIYMFEFDNSYSWVKAKSIIWEYTILTPMEIIEERPFPWLSQILHEKVQENAVPQDKILRVIKDREGSQLWRQQQMRKAMQQSSKFLIKVSYSEPRQLYNLHMRRPDGSIYEYESEDKNLLIKKVRSIKATDDAMIEWSVYGIKADSAQAVVQQLEKEREKYMELEEQGEGSFEEGSLDEGKGDSIREQVKSGNLVRVTEQCDQGDKPEQQVKQVIQESKPAELLKQEEKLIYNTPIEESQKEKEKTIQEKSEQIEDKTNQDGQKTEEKPAKDKLEKVEESEKTQEKATQDKAEESPKSQDKPAEENTQNKEASSQQARSQPQTEQTPEKESRQSQPKQTQSKEQSNSDDEKSDDKEQSADHKQEKDQQKDQKQEQKPEQPKEDGQ